MGPKTGAGGSEGAAGGASTCFGDFGTATFAHNGGVIELERQVAGAHQADLARHISARVAGSGHANEIAVGVDGQAAGVAGVDFSVGFDPLIGAILVFVEKAGDHTLGEGDCGSAQTRIADHRHLVARQQVVAVPAVDADEAKVLGERPTLIVQKPDDLEDSQIVFWGPFDHLRDVFQDRCALEIGRHHANHGHAILVEQITGLGLTHDVEVGQNEPFVGIQDRAAACVIQVAVVVRHQDLHGGLERLLQRGPLPRRCRADAQGTAQH